MQLSNQTKFLLLVAGVVVLIYFLNSGSGAIHNEGSLDIEPSKLASVNTSQEDNTRYSGDTMPESGVSIPKSKNQALPEEGYKYSDFANGRRGNGESESNNFIDDNNDLVSGSQRDNDEFTGLDASEGKLAGYKGGQRRELTDEEIFKAEDYLPQEEAQDWFEVMPEPIQSKNRHLISVTRPVGINTIGTSLKNASYDIRGCPVNPKMVISPKIYVNGCKIILIIIF